MLEAPFTRACFSVTHRRRCVLLLSGNGWLHFGTRLERLNHSADCDPTHESVWFVPYMGSRFVQHRVVIAFVAFLSYHERNSKEAQIVVDERHASLLVLYRYICNCKVLLLPYVF